MLPSDFNRLFFTTSWIPGGAIDVICFCLLREKEPVEEGSSKFGEWPELARLVHSQSVSGNHLQLHAVGQLVFITTNILEVDLS